MKYFILTLSLVFFAGSVSASIVIPWADQFTNNTFSITTGKLTFDLNRTAFYKAMQSEDKNLVDAQIAALNSTPSDIKNAFLGAMTMKRAGIGGNPVSRLMLFKKGHELLEAAIQQEPDNSEFRFLRLMIQENAPEMLGYNVDEEQDSEFIRKSYKSLPVDLQKTIADYNKTSKILKLNYS